MDYMQGYPLETILPNSTAVTPNGTFVPPNSKGHLAWPSD
jgi:hypothetical protein